METSVEIYQLIKAIQSLKKLFSMLMFDFSAPYFIILLSSNIYSLIAAIIRTLIRLPQMFPLDRFFDLNFAVSPFIPVFTIPLCRYLYTTILVIFTHTRIHKYILKCRTR